MNTKIYGASAIMIACMLGIGSVNAQIKINKSVLGAATNATKAVTFSDADAADLARSAVKWMDENNPVAAENDPYTVRLRKLTAGLENVDGLTLNYKVYKVVDVNAFACADGSVRVFSSLMDIMDDNELMGIIGHEIGHVKNKDTRDAIRQAYLRAAVGDAAGAASNIAATLSDSELGKLANEILDAKYSRKQESEADVYSYHFLKKNGFDVMGIITAFKKFSDMEEGAKADKMTKMKSSHPASNDRVDTITKLAKKDGLYKG